MSAASADFVFVCASGDLADGDALCFKVGPAAKPVLLCRSEGEVFALDPWCSHASQELAGGTVRAEQGQVAILVQRADIAVCSQSASCAAVLVSGRHQ